MPDATNASIARVFAEMADVLEIMGDNAFKIRAYKAAAETIEAYPQDVATIALSDVAKLREVKGIGDAISKKIHEIATTGKCLAHQELLRERPATLLDMLKLDGVGPKKVKAFYEDLGLRTLDDLEAACKAGKVRGLPRMSEKAEQKILASIAELKGRTGRTLLAKAEGIVQRLRDMLLALPGVTRVEPAGSFRRRRETVGDIDLLCIAQDPPSVMQRFASSGAVLGQGETKCSIRLSSGIQADLRILPEESFGAALHYFTGSKGHNIAIRSRALRMGLTVNEYGVFEMHPSGEAGRKVAGATEEEVFKAVGLPWIPPELREDRGEIDAALAGTLPRLVERAQIRGDVHMHTDASDGLHTLRQMAEAAVARGRGYIAITDHSKSLMVARGLDEQRLLEQGNAIRALDAELSGRLRVLRGTECDILKDGAMDLHLSALASLDVVVGSVHSHMSLTRQEQTERVVRAIESKRVDIIGHPTGRRLLSRDPYPLDMERVMRAAKAHGVALEISSSPERLDLSDVHARAAREMGVKLVISTDSHGQGEMDNLRFGVDTARRAGCRAEDILNTLEVDRFLEKLHEGHR